MFFLYTDHRGRRLCGSISGIKLSPSKLRGKLFFGLILITVDVAYVVWIIVIIKSLNEYRKNHGQNLLERKRGALVKLADKNNEFAAICLLFSFETA